MSEYGAPNDGSPLISAWHAAILAIQFFGSLMLILLRLVVPFVIMVHDALMHHRLFARAVAVLRHNRTGQGQGGAQQNNAEQFHGNLLSRHTRPGANSPNGNKFRHLAESFAPQCS